MPVIHAANAQGSLSGILIKSEDACNSSKQEPFTLQVRNDKGQAGEVPWIALLDSEGAKCSLSVQLENIKASGAAAVVSKDQLPRQHTSLPVMMVNEVIFGELLRQLSLPSTGKIRSSAPIPHLAVALHFSNRTSRQHSPLHPLLLLVCFLGPTVVVFTALFFWQLLNGSTEDDQLFPGETSRFLSPQQPESERPAPLSLVSSLPKRSSGGPGSEQDVCAICLDEFEVGGEVRQLPCGHEFHLECVDPWLLTKKRKCPVCKGDIVKGPGEKSNLWTRISSLVRSSDQDSIGQASAGENDFQIARQMALESRSNIQ